MTRIAFLAGFTLIAACSSGPATVQPTDPLALCLAGGDPSASRAAIESKADAKISAAPLGEEGATALFGTSTPRAASLWKVTIEVKALPPGATLLAGPPQVVVKCEKTVARWEKMWPSTVEGVFPDPPPMSRSAPDLVPVPALYRVEAPPNAIEPADAAAWDKLDEVTGKTRPRKTKYKLTAADKTAWAAAEEDRRAAAQTAHDAAVTENRARTKAFEEGRAVDEAARAKVTAARDALGRLGGIRCDPPVPIGAGEIVFTSPARCEFVSVPSTSPPAAGAACATPPSFELSATWALAAEGAGACTVDASARRVLADDASPETLRKVFEGGPLSLGELRRTR